MSDTRTPETDTSGARMRALLEGDGHEIRTQEILRDDVADVTAHVEEMLADDVVECVVLSGGTGIAPRDTTYEAVEKLLEKRLDGFGELFRMLSFHEIGAAAMLTRAMAGVAENTLVVLLPGSTAAVELGLTRLLLPELRHMVSLVRGG